MHELRMEQTVSLPATLSSLTKLGNVLRHFLAPLQLSESWIYPLDLALCEAASNIIRHGYEDDATQIYRVTLGQDDKGIFAILYDTGFPVPREKLLSNDEASSFEVSPAECMSEGGRGWLLIHACVDSVDYQRVNDENRLRLWRALPED